MTYWRMQLHPSESTTAMAHAIQSVAAGFIGLDFAGDVGDLRLVDKSKIKKGQQDYLDFALKMKPGDLVLIIAHHFPFALVTVNGDYNYIAHRETELGVWFRHFRRIDRDKTVYWADKKTNAAKWSQYRMTDTISPLRDEDSKSYKLIETWKSDIPLDD